MPDGKIYLIGGYFSDLGMFLNNCFILDEYRSVLVPLNSMIHYRADHAIIVAKGKIFCLGGCNKEEEGVLKSIKDVESYSIEKDQWSELAPMINAR